VKYPSSYIWAFSLFTYIFLCLKVVGYSQTQDSLKTLLKSTSNDKQRLDIYNQLIDEYWHVNPQKAIKYSDSAFQIASNIKYPEGLLKALSNKGISFYTNGEYDSARKYYKEAIELSKQLDINTNVPLYYLSLLKKEADYKAILELIDKELSETPLEQADASLLRSAAEAFIEMGNLEESEKYLLETISRKRYEEDIEYKANTNRVLAQYLELVGDYDSAQSILDESIKYYISLNDSLTLAESKLALGNVMVTRGITKDAQAQFQEALKIYQNVKYDFGIARAKFELGSFYSGLAEYTNASKLLFEALDVFEEQNNLIEITKVYLELGWINSIQKISDKAEEYIQKAISISSALENNKLLSRSYNMLGTYYDRINEVDNSFEAYQAALDFRRKVGDKRGIAAVLYNIGYVEEKRGNYEKTEELYLEAYELDKEIGNALGIAISESSLGSLYTKLGDFKNAEAYLSKSREKFLDLKSQANLLDNYEYTAELLEKQGKYLEANTYYKKIIDLNNKLTNERISSTMAELEVKYDLRNKEREIQLLNLENTNREQELSLKEQVIKNQRFFIIIVTLASILLLFLVITSYRLLRSRSRTNRELESLNRKIQEKNEEITTQAEELQEANIKISYMNQNLEEKVEMATEDLKQAYKELDTFFYRASHDFRGPLTTFLGLKEVAQRSIHDKSALELFDKVGNTAQQLDKMVNKLKAISLITDSSLAVGDINLVEVAENVLVSKKDIINAREVTVKKDFETEILIEANTEIVKIILDNIIENAILYNSGNKPLIDVKIKTQGDDAIISVSDNGDGIPEKYQPLVFDMYFRCNELSQGNGLGLYLVKKAVDKLNGDIEISSDLNTGTTVKVTLPVK